MKENNLILIQMLELGLLAFNSEILKPSSARSWIQT